MTRLLTALLSLLFLASWASAAEDVSTWVRSSEDGSRIEERLHSGAPAGPADADLTPGWPEPLLRGELLWHRNYTDATYTTAALCLPDGMVAAGTYLNPPKQAEVVPLAGDGTPAWTYPGTEFYLEASRDGSVIAGVDANSATLTVTVYCWTPDSSTPLWSYPISPASRGSFRTVDVSADGSTIAVLVSMQEGSAAARLYLFQPDSPTPIGVYDGPAGFARNLSLGADGRYAAFIGLATAYVVDRDAETVRWSGSMGATNDPIAISTDGQYLAYGWTSLRLLQWNGTAYATAWTVPGAGFSLFSCAFSEDGSTFVAGWCPSSYLQNKVQAYHPASSTPLWTYLYPLASGGYQDVPYDLSMTPSGDFILVGSWGDQVGLNDELHLFDRATGTPQWSFDTPGSVFDADLGVGANGLHIVSCGKGVHANQTGRGGDLYSLLLPDPSSVEPAAGAASGLRLAALPCPFRPGESLRFALEQPGILDAAIFAADGRQVRLLARSAFGPGPHALSWDGRDEAGRPAGSGVYFVKLANAESRVVGRTVVIR